MGNGVGPGGNPRLFHCKFRNCALRRNRTKDMRITLIIISHLQTRIIKLLWIRLLKWLCIVLLNSSLSHWRFLNFHLPSFLPLSLIQENEEYFHSWVLFNTSLCCNMLIDTIILRSSRSWIREGGNLSQKYPFEQSIWGNVALKILTTCMPRAQVQSCSCQMRAGTLIT